MNAYQKRTLQAFRRVQAWLAAHPDLGATPQAARPLLVPGGGGITGGSTTVTTAAARHATALNATVEALTGLAAEEEAQNRAVRGAEADTARLKWELVTREMRHVTLIAKSAIPDVVKMTAALRPPVQKDHEGILAAADAMGKAAAQYKDILVERGLPSDFIEELRKATDALRKAIDARGIAIGQRRKAGEALRDVFLRGKRVVDALTVVVARRYRDDIATIAEWNQVRRVVNVASRAVAAEAIAEPFRAASAPAQSAAKAEAA